jgi:hypothetical protein
MGCIDSRGDTAAPEAMNIAPPQRVARGLGAASEEHCPDASTATVLQHVEAVEAAAPHGGFLQLRELDARHDRQITVRFAMLYCIHCDSATLSLGAC